MSQTGSPPVRFPSGVTTSPPGFLLGNLANPNPARLFSYFNDFSTYAAGDWTVTSTNSGTSALTSTGGLGGKLLLTTGATENNYQGNQLTTTNFAVTAGCQMWFMINVALADATQTDFYAGFADTFADETPTDGIYFVKVDGSTTMNLLLTNTGTSTTIPVGTMTTAATTLGFYWNGVDRLDIFSTIPYVAAGGNTSLSPGIYANGGNQIVNQAYTGGTYPLTNLPAAGTLMTMGWLFLAGSAGAKTATLDYVYGAQEIVARY